ncbi:MAG: carboxypeptidase regulatory-like domain-containing protein, partial [Colwellia sp.]|nr:carboxypeptidase regulatory-like domain-containing protein [Colwellia sp.]
MNILHTMKIILFLSFFVSLGGCKTTITGTVFNGVVSGATVTLSNMENQEVAVATSNESGSFTITFNNSKKSSCYLLEAKGGTVDNAEFIDVLTATYCGSTDIPFNLT